MDEHLTFLASCQSCASSSIPSIGPVSTSTQVGLRSNPKLFLAVALPSLLRYPPASLTDLAGGITQCLRAGLQVQVSSLPLTSCMTIDRFLHLSRFSRPSKKSDDSAARGAAGGQHSSVPTPNKGFDKSPPQLSSSHSSCCSLSSGSHYPHPGPERHQRLTSGSLWHHLRESTLPLVPEQSAQVEKAQIPFTYLKPPL